jgi:hypothetical protein
MVLKLTGTHPGGAYEVHCPTNNKIYVVWNGTAGDVTFKTVAGTGIQVNAGAVLILYCDGTNVIQLAGLVAAIDDIGDVVIAAAASGQMLRFGEWYSVMYAYLGIRKLKRELDGASLAAIAASDNFDDRVPSVESAVHGAVDTLRRRGRRRAAEREDALLRTSRW